MQMAVVIIKNLVIFTLFIVLSSANATGVCQNEASCIALKECTVLYTRMLDFDDSIIHLLRKLHCGFDSSNKPMICCPPGLKDITPSDRTSVKFNPVELLPDTKICGIQNNILMIGGSRTELDEHPWMALLRYDEPKGSGFYCGGVLISSKYVLTAAHCVNRADLPNSWTLSHVRLGEWNLTSDTDCYYNDDDCSPPALDMPVEEVIVHENYNFHNKQQENDIALIRLAKEVQFNDFVKPICLPTNSQLGNNSFYNSVMEIAGWGTSISRSISNIKLKFRVPVIKRDDCNNIYTRVGRSITEKQLCAGGLNQDFCKGDSGGPLMGQMVSSGNLVVYGIESYGPSPCGIYGWPGVYTRVTAYVDWILSKIRP